MDRVDLYVRVLVAIMTIATPAPVAAEWTMGDPRDYTNAVRGELGIGGLVGGYLGPSGTSPGLRFPGSLSQGQLRGTLEYDLQGIETGTDQAQVHRFAATARWTPPIASKPERAGFYFETGVGRQLARFDEGTQRRWDLQFGFGLDWAGRARFARGSRWSYGVTVLVARAFDAPAVARCVTACAPARELEIGIFYSFEAALTRAR